jgi:hypothetical protein
MPRSNNRGGQNNNPVGRNQYSDGGVMDLVRERPVAAAAAAAGAAAAGLFLWSRRTQISNQLSSLSEQIGEWTQSMTSGDSSSFSADDTASLTSGQSGLRSSTSSQSGMSETGGGNASLGRSSGGGGSRGSASGRGRAQSTAATQE